MTNRDLDEARTEVAMASTFGRRPAQWAVDLVAESDTPEGQRMRDEAALDLLDEAVFGQVRPESAEVSESAVRVTARAAGASVEDFERAGLCEESALRAARGLLAGTYFSFEDAAVAQTVFDTDRRNWQATPERIGEVAESLKGAES